MDASVDFPHNEPPPDALLEHTVACRNGLASVLHVVVGRLSLVEAEVQVLGERERARAELQFLEHLSTLVRSLMRECAGR